ncbi:MAG: N-acetyltransferase [Cyclobacteriaceae bacterium]
MIAPLNPQDIRIAEQMHQVFQVSYRVEAELLGVEDFPPLKRSVSDLLGSSTSFFGYWMKQQLIAVVEVEEQENTTNINSLVVDPAFFRRGIARQLLAFVRASYPSGMITVETGADNLPAIRLYENFGFKKEKQWWTSIGIKKIKLSLPIA